METITPEEISVIPKKMPTRLEILDRLQVTLDLLCSGYSSFQIWRYKKEWGINLRQVQHYVSHCKKKLETQNNIDFNKIRAKHIARYENMFKKFHDQNDLRGAIVANTRLEELEGVKQGDIFPLNPVEEKKRLERVKNELFKMNPKLIARPDGVSSFEVT